MRPTAGWLREPIAASSRYMTGRDERAPLRRERERLGEGAAPAFDHVGVACAPPSPNPLPPEGGRGLACHASASWRVGRVVARRCWRLATAAAEAARERVPAAFWAGVKASLGFIRAR